MVRDSVGTNRRFGIIRGVGCTVISLALVVGGIVTYAVKTPDNVNLVSLEWVRSASSAAAMVGARASAFRTGLYWDLVLTLTSTVGILVACYLGRHVFWTVGLLRWAWMGYFAALLAGASAAVQDALLLSVLHASPIHGSWIFRIVAALSLLRFSLLIAGGSIALIALGTTLSRLATNATAKCRWLDARAAVHENGDDIRPLVIPAPPIEIDRRDEPRATRLDASIDRSWWESGNRNEPPVHFVQNSSSPDGSPGGIAICVSGGGIRSATVALGALQALRSNRADGLAGIDHLISVSGGGYTTGGMQLALCGANGGTPGAGGAAATDVFAPGSPEEDHLRRHGSYLSDGPRQWLEALGVLLRNLMASLVIIGLTVATIGLALGWFYRNVPIVHGGLEAIPNRLFAPPGAVAPGYPAVPWGVTLGLGCLIALAVLLYVLELAWSALTGSRPMTVARLAAAAVKATLLVAAIGVVIPAIVWVSSWLTWHLGITSVPLAGAGSATAVLSYVGVLAAVLWRKKQVVTDAATDLKKGEKVVNGVLPNSMVQKLLLWIAIVALVFMALVVSSWVATSGLDHSWWAFLVVGPLVFLAIFLDQTSMSLHPFYRRRLASAFAVRRSRSGEVSVADPYDYGELTPLSSYGQRRRGWPEVTFAASANLTGQDRTPPGRRAVPYAMDANYVGGPEVGWIRTDFLQSLVSKTLARDLTVEAAMAISGAAFASAMGAQTRSYEVFFTLTNARLGAWLPNPDFVALKLANLNDWTVPDLPRYRRLSYFAREIFGIHRSTSRLLLCTDGGHYDNLGLVETLRRRCGLIYCFDASGATAPMADTLAGALMLAREELGVEIDLADYEALVPGSGEPLDPSGPFSKLNSRLVKSAIITGTIHYPTRGSEEAFDGRLIFAQADLTSGLPYDLLEFTQDDPGFPNDGTADQWFDCDRFDAYEALGRFLGACAVETQPIPSQPSHPQVPPIVQAEAQAGSSNPVASDDEGSLRGRADR
jgi:hypothetical protein